MDLNVCKEVTSGMDYVFHIAGIKGSIEVTKSKPTSFFVPLLMFNTNILEAFRMNGVKKLVYTSSIGTYSNAEILENWGSELCSNGYMYPGWTKRMAEMQIKAYNEQYGINNWIS